MNRRSFLLTSSSAVATALVPSMPGADAPDPWSKNELMEPTELAAILNSRRALPHIFCVAFPVLYRQKHISGAVFAGPTSKPEGLADLRAAVASLPKNTAIVLYCGCCPIKDCPNIRPAFQALKELGFTNLRALDLPTNFLTDWDSKGYPVTV